MRSVRCGFVFPRALMKSTRPASLALNSACSLTRDHTLAESDAERRAVLHGNRVGLLRLLPPDRLPLEEARPPAQCSDACDRHRGTSAGPAQSRTWR